MTVEITKPTLGAQAPDRWHWKVECPELRLAPYGNATSEAEAWDMIGVGLKLVVREARSAIWIPIVREEGAE